MPRITNMSKSKMKVFISHSHKDAAKAQELSSRLSGEGVSVFDEQTIKPGEDGMSQIQEALDEASFYIMLVSPEFAESAWAAYESGHAIGRSMETGAKIIPVLIKGGSVPDYIKQYQTIDARHMSIDEVSSKLTELLQAA